jgi:hypothetical protein
MPVRLRVNAIIGGEWHKQGAVLEAGAVPSHLLKFAEEVENEPAPEVLPEQPEACPSGQAGASGESEAAGAPPGLSAHTGTYREGLHGAKKDVFERLPAMSIASRQTRAPLGAVRPHTRSGITKAFCWPRRAPRSPSEQLRFLRACFLPPSRSRLCRRFYH